MGENSLPLGDSSWHEIGVQIQVERPWDLARDSGQRSWHVPIRITAHPRGAFISVGDWTPTETNLLLLTTWRGGSLLDWDKHCGSCAVWFAADFTAAAHFNLIKRLIFFLVFRSTLSYHKERNLAKKLIYFPIQKWLKISFTRSSSSDSPRIVPRCS